ncbi:MAG: creatininase family protein [Trueperaceae bacterium]|nr:creatininase family protein [Trueperaceae bacterium]
MNRALDAMTWPEAEVALTATRPVILPLGSTEQHGPHMSMGTDNVMVSFWAKRLAASCDGLYLPTLNYGQVWSAREFPGTISLSPSALEAVLVDVADSLYRHGVRRLVLLSGHMGNAQVMVSAARKLLELFPDMVTLRICYPSTKQVMDGIAETPLWNGNNFHAAEIETSLMLAVAPEACRMELAPSEYPEVPTGYAGRVVPWREFSRTGVFGDASAATAEKGERLISRWLEVMTELVQEAFEAT